ncbi:hypothetical protein BJV82DRAFT_716437 [Fennellomyces sp. T-0311]|nr:hypothetical protein BJV82DRAFT_716437 [Fennellomyces sp. T-0311]
MSNPAPPVMSLGELPTVAPEITMSPEYEPIVLGYEVKAPRQDCLEKKTAIKPKHIMRFLRHGCKYTESTAESLYLMMVQQVQTLGLDAIFGKYSHIRLDSVDGGLKEIVYGNLATYMEKVYGVPISSCEDNWVVKGVFSKVWGNKKAKQSKGKRPDEDVYSCILCHVHSFAPMNLERQLTMISEDFLAVSAGEEESNVGERASLPRSLRAPVDNGENSRNMSSGEEDSPNDSFGPV